LSWCDPKFADYNNGRGVLCPNPCACRFVDAFSEAQFPPEALFEAG